MDKFYEWLAYRLPEKLVYFCALRLASLYTEAIPTHLRVTTALRRWVVYNNWLKKNEK